MGQSTRCAGNPCAFKSLEILHRQLQLGAIGYLGLLTTENTYQTALIAVVQAQAVTSTVSLPLAPGRRLWGP